MVTIPVLGCILLAVRLLSVAAPDFTERELVVGSGEWSVPGVLTLPASGNARAVAVLLHGSGPGPADNLKEEAHGLARRGVATLRYTKRPTAHATRYRALGRRATLAEEHIEDAVLASRAPADVIESQVRYVGQLRTDSAEAEDAKRTLAAVTQMRSASMQTSTHGRLGMRMSRSHTLFDLPS